MRNYLNTGKFIAFLNARYILLLILCLGFFLRIYQLDSLPGEIWGDVIEGYRFSEQILIGEWPFYFVLGNGPLFFYIGAIFYKLFGLSFITLKLTSVFLGMILLIVTYFLTKEVFNERIALLTVFLLAVSKWAIIFSRLGTMNILVPVFAALIFYFFFRVVHKEELRSFVFLSLLTGIGLYNYPAFIFVPFTLCILFIYILIRDRKFIFRNLGKIIISVSIFLSLSVPFLRLLPDFEVTNKNSYFGSKLFGGTGNRTGSLPEQFVINTVNSFAMFHFKGDEIFRVNVKNQPQLDLLSGIFLLIGIVYLVNEKKWRKYAFYLITPFLVLQLPSILVLNFPAETPSATRSIGILPFLYIFVALGIHFSLTKLVKAYKFVYLAIILVLIMVFNVKSVFVDYEQGLPNRNTPFGKIIAREIENLPITTNIYMFGCCWGEWGHPDSDNIRYVLKNKRDIITDLLPVYESDKSCYSLETLIKLGEKAYIIVDPRSDYVKNKIRDCYPKGNEETIYANGFTVAWEYKIAQ